MDREKRYIFSGHAIGASAQFNKIDRVEGVHHIVPTLAASALPVTGGLSKGHAANYCYDVDKPRRRVLLSVRHAESTSEGRDFGDRFETEVHALVRSLNVVGKLHADRVEMHLQSDRSENNKVAVHSKGNHIDGLYLGEVHVIVGMDNDVLRNCGNKEQLSKFFYNQPEEFRREQGWRFKTDANARLTEENGYCTCSIVNSIKLEGPDDEKQKIEVKGYKIYWPGFGWIVLGEVVVGENDRQLTMIRLAMGSDDGGVASVADGQQNGHIGT
jgi:hypothetical protein